MNMTALEEQGARMAVEILLFLLVCIVIAGAVIKWGYKKRTR
jgi:hypothetical protein